MEIEFEGKRQALALSDNGRYLVVLNTKFDDLSLEIIDVENIQTIITMKNRFFPGKEGKVKLLGYLEELFESDGQYSTMEKLMMRGLEKLI